MNYIQCSRLYLSIVRNDQDYAVNVVRVANSFITFITYLLNDYEI